MAEKTEKSSADLLWTAKVARLMDKVTLLGKIERAQYRTDALAVMCSGQLSAKDASSVQNGLRFENAMYVASRLFVPLGFFLLYRRGVFAETFTFGEMRHIIRIAVGMHAIDLTGHSAFRMYTQPIMDAHVEDAS